MSQFKLSHLLLPVVLSALGGCAVAGCTFYTACPTGNAQTNPPNGSGGGGGGTVVGDGGQANQNGGSGGSETALVTDGDIPEGDWRATMPDLTGFAELCGPVFYITSKPGADEVVASIFNAGLWATHDGGDTWAELGTGKGSDKVNNRAGTIVYDPDDADVFWEAGSYGPGVLYTSDGGETFEQLGDLMHLDSVSVDFSDPERKTLLATGHEAQQIMKSTDGGATWSDISDTIPEGTKDCRYPLIIDSDTFLLGCGGYVDMGTPATLRSTDGGKSWEQVFMNGGGAEPLWTSKGDIYWSKQFDDGFMRSTDNGATWQDLGAYKVLLPVKPVEMPDGRIASLTEDAVVLSSDGGKSWKRATAKFPYKPAGFTYSPAQKAFFIFRFGCFGSAMPASGDEIQRFDFDYESY